MADAPQVERGSAAAPGDPNAPPLPSGEATDVNQAAERAKELAAGQTPQAGPPPTAQGAAVPAGPPPPSGPREAPVRFQPQTEDDHILFAPPQNGEDQGAAQPSPQGKVPLPPQVVQGLPSLQTLASEPGASPQVSALFRLLAQQAQ